MNRAQLEHVLRASAAITGASEFVLIGSQSILGPHPDAPRELLISMELDLFSPRSPEAADLVEGSIGEGSPFHMTFGYCAHGVGENTAVLPSRWKERLVPVRSPATGGATGWCLEPNDLAVSKLVAGREKDIDFLVVLFRTGLADPDVVRERLNETVLPDVQRQACMSRLARIVAKR